MARIVLASALSRWLPESAAVAGARDVSLDVSGERLDQALDTLFEAYPKLRGYVLDEHGAVRHHVAIFVDGTAIADKQRPNQALGANAEIYIMQALSGG